ncbi:DUF2264 domain-containing protein [Marinilactibacillus kalidii]|uniref:DUF2264 domain-containing protein n=1 Tax=Marinilactibacillus kalidii TaxID=2820274 RepID=UPI001ABE455B|nr:DUF2264 domain-containing protein [Marinilactibacillus kalidii]
MTRKNWISIMDKIADPVISNLSKETLHETLPTEFHNERKDFGMLEAFGRTLTGIAAWVECDDIDDPEEKTLQADYRKKILLCLDKATDKQSKDYMNFGEGGQPLVDTAFLAHAIIRAPKQIGQAMPDEVKANVITALKDSRKIMPLNMNWNLFSAMVEGALYVLGGDYDLLRVLYAIRLLDDWYLGDGVYGDGPVFHYDYYNSFVMQPMAIDLLDLLYKESDEVVRYREKMVPRFTRYAEIQERLISPDGTYPIVGRSVAYRFGAFQALAQAALQERLPESTPPAQVRTALTAVIDRTISSPSMFDKKGWLLPGIYGEQPELAEEYIGIGSLYLCSAVFLPLGLPESHSFWKGQEQAWTSKKVWNGESISLDHSIHG